MLKAGTLNKRAEVVIYTGGVWEMQRGIWASITPKERVIYSPYAPAVPGAEIIIRNRAITPQEALRAGGQHYMLTLPFEQVENGAGLKIIAAAVALTTCTVSRQDYTMGELNRPVPAEPEKETFQGVLAQKYVRWQQDEPNAKTESLLILTTPKAVVLESGDIIKIAETSYAVQTCYTLDSFRNDYEIAREADA